MTIVVKGAATAATSSPDALVAGTPYHATADIRCVTTSGGKATGSNASIKMSATKSGDITTVHIGAAEAYSIPDASIFVG